MGGRSATSGVATFGKKAGTRLSPKQYKDAVSDAANFILRDLEKTPALQKIIRKSFAGGEELITLEASGLGIDEKRILRQAVIKAYANISADHNKQKDLKKSVDTWSAYDVARAKADADKQILLELERLKKKLD